MKKYWHSLFVFSILLSACSSNSTSDDFTEIIPTLNLISGETREVVISDLFYSESYDIKLLQNPDLEVDYLPATKDLVIKVNDDFAGLTFQKFILNDSEYAIPIRAKKIPSVTFQYQPEREFKKLTLFGQFNSWDRNNLPMTDQNGDGIFEISVPLEPGTYQYKFFLDGEEIVDPINPEKISNGSGSFNSIIKVESTENIGAFLHTAASNFRESKTALSFIYTEANSSPTLSRLDIKALINNSVVPNKNIDIDGNRFTVILDSESLNGSKLLRVSVTRNGNVSNTQFTFLENGVVRANDNKFIWEDAVIYSLLTDRFSDGDKSINAPISHPELSEKANYNGGDFEGIINKINEGYFSDLGINTLWISPAYDNPDEAYQEYPAPHRWYSGYHGYWPIHHENVESRFGSMEKLKELVKLAHENDMKVLLDFVSNHVHEQHPFFKEHRDWFGKLELEDGRKNLRFWDEYRLTTWFEPYLPSFDYIGSPEAIEAMTDNAVWWLKETGADGFRHDAVKHVPNEFWRRLTEKIKAEIETENGTKVYQIGETFGNYDLISSYVNNGQLSAQFNFNIYDAAQSAFILPEKSFAELDSEMKRTFGYYGEIHVMGNIMDSHDKNRFMAYADGDLKIEQWSAIEEGWNNPPKVDDPENYKIAELYYAFMFSIPGIPVVYYGSEFGMTGASDPDNRRMMRFGDELNSNEIKMLQNVSQIINLRNDHPALRYGDYLALQADKEIYAFVRSDFNERVLIVINKSKTGKSVELNLPELYSANSAKNLITDQTEKVEGGKLSISLNGVSWKAFKLN